MCSPLPNQAEQESRRAGKLAASVPGYAPLRVDMDNPDAVKDAQMLLAWIEAGSYRAAEQSTGKKKSTIQRAVARCRNGLRRQLRAGKVDP